LTRQRAVATGASRVGTTPKTPVRSAPVDALWGPRPGVPRGTAARRCAVDRAAPVRGSTAPMRRALVALLLGLALAAVCLRLAWWQFDRGRAKEAARAAWAAQARRPPLDLARAWGVVAAHPTAFVYAPAAVEGRWHPGLRVVLRGRSRDGRPGVELVSRLDLDDGRAVWVHRGWVPSPDATRLPPGRWEPPGRVRVAGVLVPFAAGPLRDRALVDARGADTTLVVRRVHPAWLRPRTPGPWLPLLLQAQGPGGPPHPVPPTPPGLPPSRHYAYAGQWLAFALLALGGGFVLARRSARAASRLSPLPPSSAGPGSRTS